MKNLEELFIHGLKDIYYAEKQILKALPKMSEQSDSSDLQQAFSTHLKETEGHVDRLEQVFQLAGTQASGEKCPAIEGIIEEAKEQMSDTEDGDVRDAAMIAAAQAVEHYEITRYGSLKAWAEQLGMSDAAKLLDQTLAEEHSADEKLTRLAENRLNKQAA